MLSLLNKERSIPKVCSPTALQFPSGADIKVIPLDSAKGTSILSNPAPTRAINFKLVPAAIKVESHLNLLLITIPSYPEMICSISDLEEV